MNNNTNCPDYPKPEAGEFTKKCRGSHRFSFSYATGDRDIRWLKEACDIIDRLTQELADYRSAFGNQGLLQKAEAKIKRMEEALAKPPAVAKPAAKEPWEMTKEEFSRIEYAQQKVKVEKLKTSSQEVFDKAKEITGGKGRKWNEKYIAEGMRLKKKMEAEAAKLLKGESYYINKHKKTIQHALSENKPVPREVLEEYKGEKWADEALEEIKKIEDDWDGCIPQCDVCYQVQDIAQQALQNNQENKEVEDGG